MYKSKNDITLPHSYASYSIIKDMSPFIFGQEYVHDKEQWKDVKSDVISHAVYILFSVNGIYNMLKKTVARMIGSSFFKNV